MRYVYITLIVLLTAVVLLFKFQNLTSVTIWLLGMSATLPISVLVIFVYVLGMVTGGALFSLVRSWIHGRRRRTKLANRSCSNLPPSLSRCQPPESFDGAKDDRRGIDITDKSRMILQSVLRYSKRSGTFSVARDPSLRMVHNGRCLFLFAGGDSQRFGQTPCVVEGKIGPHQHVETGAGRRRRHALQSDIFQQLLAIGLAFGTELFGGIFDRLEDRWIG